MMKTFKYILSVLLFSTILTSCEDGEIIFNGEQTLVTFGSRTASLPVNINDSNTINIPINVTTTSATERTFPVEVVTEVSNADPVNYTLGSAVIPANSYVGTLSIQATDNTIETSPKNLVLSISEGSDYVAGSNSITISIFQVCPIPEGSFTGSYTITQTSPYVDGPTLSDGATVTLTGSGTQRTFMTANYPAYCGTLRPFTINLVCNEVIIPAQNSGCPCADGTDWFTNGITPGTYDASDDSEFTITFTDDTNGDCGASAQTTYRFVKQ